MKRIEITAEQLDQLVGIGRALADQLEYFAASPEATLRRFVGSMGYELAIVSMAEPEPFSSADVPLGQIVDRDPLTGETPRQLERAATEPPRRQRQPSPQELEGYEELLRGRKGKILRPAGAGSFIVLLNDGNEIVLPEHALFVAGCQPPVRNDANEEHVRGWETLIAGRQGTILGAAGAGSYTVQFPDGATLTLPEAALPYAGCEIPKQ